MIFPGEDDYLQLTRRYRLVPVSAEWGADMETPISLFTRLSALKPAFLLESGEGGEKLARYSFIGLEPLAIYRHKGVSGQLFLPEEYSRDLMAVFQNRDIICRPADARCACLPVQPGKGPCAPCGCANPAGSGTGEHGQGIMTIRQRDNASRINCKGTEDPARENTACLEMAGNPFTIVEQLMDYWRGPVLPELPRFYGGAVGYFAYDLVRWLERLPSTTGDDLNLPDMVLLFTGTLLVMDHLRHTLRVVVNTLPGSRPEVARRRAVERIEHIWRLINGPVSSVDRPADGFYGSLREGNGPATGGEGDSVTGGEPMNKAALQELPSSVTREEFQSLVRRAKEYIRQGDILQVVLSQRLQVPFAGDPFQVYRRLRRINPSPYLYYLDLGDVAIAGSSPEMLVRVENGMAETRPIAGTRPRGASAGVDEALAAELLVDPKERAEHVMLVDLGRNDLGRVCKPGTVTVPQFMVVEKYSHVMHLVSAVRGNLAEGRTAFDALKACFPAGTVSGAPKVRAMEIIEELEPESRGPYAGAVGYLGYNGNLDTAITIRTIVFHRGYAYVQAGAGIVADSDPEREYQETLNKARALLQTLAASENPAS